CSCAITTVAATKTDDFVGSPTHSEFPDTLKLRLGPNFPEAPLRVPCLEEEGIEAELRGAACPSGAWEREQCKKLILGRKSGVVR
ncbi:MAG TPA: hypothetical protein VFG04_05090, partial [Planctomycetaceae bacterium]|nr:hypothetical protein [Planctomycetaceae bacterium]